MDISLVAKMKKYDEFISCYNEGDEKKVYKGKSLLFYSLSNNDTESRYLITDFFDMTFATYYAKKRGEGKPHRVAITHVAKKLIRVIYALESQDIDFNAQELR